jgi:ABC-type uncharacterized transport system permease subunit
MLAGMKPSRSELTRAVLISAVSAVAGGIVAYFVLWLLLGDRGLAAREVALLSSLLFSISLTMQIIAVRRGR